MQRTVHVRDPRALKALAHPLRLKLLGLLRLEGPSTATLLGRRLGESSGATSYHLRELARYGFIDEAPGGSGRERWWQALHRSTHWEAEEVGDDEVLGELHGFQVAHRARVLQAWLAQRPEMDRAWDVAESLNDYALRLTPDQARALVDELNEVVQRYADAHHASDAGEGETVSLFVDLVPLKEWPL